jgi:MoaA/NifB/PqqE/SkfB family radical SAM enzyme
MYKDLDMYTPGYVQDLEIALDYTCNMMCRMCNPGASSKWNIAQSVIKQFAEHSIDLDGNNQYRSYQDQLRSVLDNTDLSHARIVKVEGGEPFYAKNLEWFLDKLDREVVDRSNLYINIFTNGSIFPSVKILEKLAKLNAAIIFSIDAVGELASTIRWGVDWDTIADNIRKWRKFADANPNMSLQTNITVSLLNVNRLEPLITFCNELNIDINFSELTFPNYLSIYQLPKAVRQRWTYDDDRLNAMIMADVAIEQEFNKFIASVNILDAYQGYSFETVNSEMYQLIQSLFPCCEA